VHRDAIPILLALSLLAAALAEAVEHLIAWARRTFACLASVPLSFPAPRPRLPADATASRDARRPGAASPRGPPPRAVAYI
jgi:hypothetical protein